MPSRLFFVSTERAFNILLCCLAVRHDLKLLDLKSHRLRLKRTVRLNDKTPRNKNEPTGRKQKLQRSVRNTTAEILFQKQSYGVLISLDYSKTFESNHSNRKTIGEN